MSKIVKWVLTFALGVAASGHIKAATMELAKLGSQKQPMSLGKLSRALNSPQIKKH